MKFGKKNITQNQYRVLILEIKDRLHNLVSSADNFLITSNNQSDLGIVTSVYVHALEEYGKLVLLNSLNLQSSLVDLTSIESDYFDHDKKIKHALNDLSPNAKTVKQGVFDPAIFDSAFFDTGTDISWNLRLIILNTDVDSDGNAIKIPHIEKTDLQQAITSLKNGRFYV